MRRTLAAIGVFAVLALGLVSAGSTTAGADDPLRLTVGTLGRIGSLDPRAGTSPIAREVWKLEYPTLTTLDSKTLDAARARIGMDPARNGRGWVYKLRRGLAWSDGKPVTAADVVYSLNHARDERWPYAANQFDDLTARALDANTVEVSRLSAADGAKPAGPADPMFPGLLLHVVPEHVFSKFKSLDPDLVKRSVSDGPWRVTGRTDDSVQLDVPEGAAGPAVRQIVFRTYPGADALVDALDHGDVDVIAGLPNSYVGRLQALQDVTVDHAGDGSQYTLKIGRPGDAALDDPRVRQAISQAIDRDQLVASAVRGVGTPGVVSTLARGTSWALDDTTVQSLTESLDAQPARARELLAVAPPIGRKLTIGVPIDRAGQRTGTFVRRALAAVGIETELAPPEGAEPDLLLAHTAIGSDPTEALERLSCDSCDERLRQYRATDDYAARLDAAHDMSDEATAQATNVGLFEPDVLEAFRSDNLTGFLRDPEIRSLVVFGPTVSQYSQLAAALPPPGEQLSNTSYVVGAVIVLGLCVATFMAVVWIRRRYVD